MKCENMLSFSFSLFYFSLKFHACVPSKSNCLQNQLDWQFASFVGRFSPTKNTNFPPNLIVTCCAVLNGKEMWWSRRVHRRGNWAFQLLSHHLNEIQNIDTDVTAHNVFFSKVLEFLVMISSSERFRFFVSSIVEKHPSLFIFTIYHFLVGACPSICNSAPNGWLHSILISYPDEQSFLFWFTESTFSFLVL